MEAIREIVMNMVVHRDYRDASDSIVKIFDDHIEFYNPGRLPENITEKDLIANTYTSTPRNKLVADVFRNMGMIEKYGSGIQRIINYFLDSGLPSPTFQNQSNGFLVTVYTDKNEDISEKVTNKVTDKVTDKVTNNQKMILQLIAENSMVSTSEIATKLGISKRKVLENIKKLKEKNIVQRIGSPKAGHWKVCKEY
jgi:ATP-dependent DNA helicase RecG